MLAADEVREAIASCAWIDAEHVREASEALRTRGLRLETPWSPAPLRSGETYLLLHDIVSAHGAAPRIRAVPNGAERAFSLETESEIDRARRGLLSVAARACRALPDDILLSGFELPLDASIIEGGSLGLSVCVALVSRALTRPPRDGVDGYAIVSTEGTLLPVVHLDTILEA